MSSHINYRLTGRVEENFLKKGKETKSEHRGHIALEDKKDGEFFMMRKK